MYNDNSISLSSCSRSNLYIKHHIFYIQLIFSKTLLWRMHYRKIKISKNYPSLFSFIRYNEKNNKIISYGGKRENKEWIS